MKYLYVCEKCGKQYEDYTAAQKCEETHLRIDNFYHEYDTEMEQFAKWDEGGVMPRCAVFATPVERKEGDDEDYPGCYFGLYELKRLLTPSEVKKIVVAREARKKKEKQWREDFDRKKMAACEKNEATE